MALPIYDKKVLILHPTGLNQIEAMILKLEDVGVVSLLDIEFAHGYYLPTLLLLHEGTPTWVGCVVT